MNNIPAELRDQITTIISRLGQKIAGIPVTPEDLLRLYHPEGLPIIVDKKTGEHFIKTSMDIAETLQGTKLSLKTTKIERLIFQAILNPTTTREMLSSYRSKYLECINKTLELHEGNVSREEGVTLITNTDTDTTTSKYTEGSYLEECKCIQERLSALDHYIQKGMDIIDQREEEEKEEEGIILTNWSIPSKPSVLYFVKLGQYVYERIQTAEKPQGVIDFTTSVAILIPGRPPIFSRKYTHYKELIVIV
jgi:hypothetical protein